MPRDTDKDNDSRGRHDRPTRARSEGGKGRSGAARGPEKKFAKRGTGGKDFGAKEGGGGRAKRPFDEGRPPRRREDGDAPRKSFGDKPRFNRDERPRADRPYAARPARAADGEKRAFKPRADRPKFDREDRGGEKRPYTPRASRDEARPSERKFGERKP